MSLRAFDEAPYHDDFYTSNVDGKNYLRILFRPGRAVQARELTQLQTVVQSQIDRFGRSVYKDGTPVIDGLASVDNFCDWVKVAGSVDDAIVDDTIFIASGPAVGISAKVLHAEQLAGDAFTYLFVKYISANTTADATVGTLKVFPANATLTRLSSVVTYTVLASDHVGIGTRISINEGVYFTRGSFVYTDPQSIYIVDNDLSGFALLHVTERVVTPVEDGTLFDNAAGSPNFAAPGAHRYAVELDLVFSDIIGDNDIHLLTIENGKVHIQARTEYSNLDRVMAQRTFEESGNYAVRPFQIDIREELNDGSNRGFSPTGSESNFVVTIEPSVAYVDGYRVELADKKSIAVSKPRTFSALKTLAQTLPVGNYVLVDNVNNATDLLAAGSTAIINSIFNLSGGRTGTCRVRGAQYVSGTGSSAVLRLYVYDVASTYVNNDPVVITRASGTFTCSALNDFAIFEGDETNTAYVLPYSAVKEVTSPNTLTVLRGFSVTASADNTISVTAAGSDLLASTSAADYLVLTATSILPVSVVAGSASTRELTVTGVTSGQSVKVLAPVSRIDVSPAIKTMATITAEALIFTSGVAPLANADIFELLAVETAASDDVTDLFTLDNGQRDTHYAPGRIILKPGRTIPDAGVGLTATYRYFVHDVTSNKVFFTVGSYPTGGGSPPMTYDEIPSYGGVRLSNCIDFRKKLTYTGDALNPDALFTAQVSEYLGRIDKVIVTSDGKFDVVRGIPADRPSEPRVPDNAMTLHILSVPAYTFAASDIGVKFIDNKRYTMRDIGSLENRVSNLEYYTSLSLLEKEASTLSIGDRFKNGILVDSFRGHSVGDVTNPDYSCAMDRQFGGLRAKALENSVRLVRTSLGSNLVVNSGLVTKKYDEVSLITQPFASISENVNPYNVFNWTGGIELSPSSDEWKDIDRRPDVIINLDGLYDSIEFLAEETGVTGTQWNEWQTNWTGVTVDSERGTAKARNVRGLSVDRPILTTTTTTESLQTRTGTNVSIIPETVNTVVGSRVVDVSFVPFIRSRKVYFRADNLKPNTRVYPFFDGQPVGPYCFTGTYDGNQYASLAEAFEFGGLLLSSESVSNRLVTSASGTVEGYFIIPNNDVLRFKTGSRVFKLTDSLINDDQLSTTKAEAFYTAQGVLESQENSIISTRVPRLVSTDVTESRTTIDSNVRVRYLDPLAQSFIIGDIPSGCFVTSLDLYFRQVDPNIPVNVYIVTVENGIPTQKVVPFSRVTKTINPSLGVSEDASVATTFEFQAPVHLQDGVEYAFVVTSNSDKYLLWVAELGGVDVNTDKSIVENPYAGVMFKSQNASTWTPDQTKDIKFILRRARFETASTNSLITLNDVETRYSLIGEINGSNTVFTLPRTAKNGFKIIVDNVLVDPADYSVENRVLSLDVAPISSAQIVYEFEYSIINLNAQQIALPGSSVAWQTSVDGGGFQTIAANDNVQLSASYLWNNPQIVLNGNLQTSSEYVSPVVDLDRVSLICVGNDINDLNTDEDLPSGGQSLARYITREVGLTLAADELDIYLTVNRPASTSVDLYVRATSGGDLDNLNWVLVQPLRSIPVTPDIERFTEVQYNTAGLVNTFTNFAIKIVMRSSSKDRVPLIKDLRAIASI